MKGEIYTWLQVKNRVPGRVSFFCWDDMNRGLLKEELEKRGIKVRFFDRIMTKDGSNLVGRFLSGWKKDIDELRLAFIEVDKKLTLVNKDYVEFKQKWLQYLEVTDE